MKNILLLLLHIAITPCLLAQNDVIPDSIPGFSEEIFTVVQEMPRFPGCEDLATLKAKQQCSEKKMQQFIKDHLQYPKQAKKNGVEGIVAISFIIKSDGSLHDFKVLRDVGMGLGAEALRVARLMQEQDIRWVPGKHAGKSVHVLYKQPFIFRLK